MMIKKYEGYLFDQLAMLERLQIVAKKIESREMLEAIEKEKWWVERKLYRPTAPQGQGNP